MAAAFLWLSIELPGHAQTDVARGKPVTASGPTWPGLSPAYLTDGNPNSLSHPLAETGTLGFTFQIDLQTNVQPGSIVLVNRNNCCPERLSNVRVSLHPHDPVRAGPGPAAWTTVVRANGTHSGMGGLDVLTAPLDPAGTFRGRYLRIENLSNAPYNPQLAEVHVYLEDGGNPNLALFRPVTSSAPTWGDFPPSHLTDGSDRSFSHPLAASGTQGFTYRVDLLRAQALDRIVVRARGDGCCAERLSRYRVQVRNAVADQPGGTNWWADVRLDGTFPPSGDADQIRAGDGTGLFAGRFVEVINLSGAPYNPQIAEIEIYGAPPPRIRYFGATAGNITATAAPGLPSRTTLSWRVEGATSLSLAPGIGTVDATNSIVVSPPAPTRYTLTASNPGGSVSESILIAVDAPFQPPRITEFSAGNTGQILDEEGNAPDWIELHNPNPYPINLARHQLTDRPGAAPRWTFPDVMVPAEGFLVVFASGANRSTPGFPLHTDFQLARAGEYLALIAPDGSTVLSRFPADHPATIAYPAQRDGVSYGLDVSGRERYFQPPTPGTGNTGTGYTGLVAEPVASIPRGFHDVAASIAITCPTQGAAIRYTTDGTVPTMGNGRTYTGPVAVQRTTTLRFAAFRDGLIPSRTVTHSHLFPADLLASDLLNPAIRLDPILGPRLLAALRDLPSVSLVAPSPSSIADDTETALSFEFIDPGTGASVQADAGASYFGGAFTGFAKESFRLAFRAVHGSRRLEFPLFNGHDHGRAAVTSFDAIELRSGSHDMVDRGFYLSNPFVDQLLLEMGHLAPHGRFVHVFLNGRYWGVYHLRERWNATMHADYLGGQPEDYEAINGNYNVGGWAAPATPYDGTGAAWQRVLNLRTDAAGVRPYLDVVNFADFMIAWMFGNAEDEWRCVGPVDAGSGFRFILNDADGWLSVNRRNQVAAWDGNQDNTGHSTTTPNRGPGDGPGSLFSMLHAHGGVDHRMLVADRIHRHLLGGGALTPARNRARLDALAAAFERPHLLESARWGYRSQTSWSEAVEVCRTQWIPGRTAQCLAQFRAAGFYPAIDAPTVTTATDPDGAVRLTLSARGQSVFYTLDGTDPRLPGGAVAPTARSAANPETLTSNTWVKARARSSRGEWSALTEQFVPAGPPLPPFSILVTEILFRPDTLDGVEEFLELTNVSDGAVNLRDASFSRGIAYRFSPWFDTILAPGQRLVLGASEHALRRLHGWDLSLAGLYQGRLDNRGERLALRPATDPEPIFDFPYQNTWAPLADGGGHSLTVQFEAPTIDPADPRNWRPSFVQGGTPGRAERGARFVDVFPDASEFGDRDGDGINNFTQYALGGGGFALLPGFPGLEDEPTLAVAWWLPAREALVTLETSTDLQTWRSIQLDPNASLVGEAVNPEAVLFQRWIFSDSAGHSSRFVRIRIERR